MVLCCVLMLVDIVWMVTSVSFFFSGQAGR